MKMVRTLVLLSLTLPLWPAAAWAQSAPPPPVQRYLIAQGGVAVNQDFEQPTPVFGAEYGERVSRSVFAYLAVHYVDDVMSTRMRDNLAFTGAALTSTTGVPWEFTGRDRAFTFTVGGKYTIPSGSRIRPYLGAGIGLVSLERTITERDLGDVSREFYDLTGLNDGIVDAGGTSATKPLVEGVLGVGGPVGRAYVDIAYRYRRGFHSFEELTFSQVTIGVGASWR